MLNRWGFQPKVLGYVQNVRGVITGLPEHSVAVLTGERATKDFPSAPADQTGESSVSRLLLPAAWAEACPVRRYWRRG